MKRRDNPWSVLFNLTHKARVDYPGFVHIGYEDFCYILFCVTIVP
ncbi:MAG: hypothetical protein Kow0031_35570 [Anaerolineae bacterium]